MLPFETVRRRKDGTDIEVMLSITPVKDFEGQVTGMTTIAQDIRQVKKLENQFRQVQKLEVVGRLAGGVAHDFNNLLTVIMGYGQVLLGMLPRQTKPWELVEEIFKAGERAAALFKSTEVMILRL